ncbi:MAG TPA: MFS transporter [Caulobacteraceae bacterium]|jgi:MFS family permease
MAFFGNDAINRVNLHYAIQALASGAGGVFFFAYLLHAGVSIPLTLVAFASIIAARFALRPLIIPLGKRWGLKPLVIAGALLTAVQYPLLAQVHGIGWPLLANLAVSGAASTLYWPSFHAYFATLGDAEHRGGQTSAREAAATVIGIVAPLIGAWALVTAGPLWTFGGVALVQAISVLPLLDAPNVRPAATAPGAYRAARQGILIFMIDGWLAATIFYVWQVALFVSVGESLKAFGGALALSALVGAGLGMLFGRHIDRGHGRRAVAVAYTAAGGLVLVQAASFGSPWLAVAANALAAVAFGLVTPALMTAIYNLAQASPCPFRFNIATEGGWDIGCGAGVLTAAAIAALGGSLSVALLLALPAIAGVAWLLWRYYGAHPAAGGVEIAAPLATEPP